MKEDSIRISSPFNVFFLLFSQIICDFIETKRNFERRANSKRKLSETKKNEKRESKVPLFRNFPTWIFDSPTNLAKNCRNFLFSASKFCFWWEITKQRTLKDFWNCFEFFFLLRNRMKLLFYKKILEIKKKNLWRERGRRIGVRVIGEHNERY